LYRFNLAQKIGQTTTAGSSGEDFFQNHKKKLQNRKKGTHLAYSARSQQSTPPYNTP
jgi:hypothetical protein